VIPLAARNFINGGGVILDRKQKVVPLSRLFSWYAHDFGGRWFGYQAQSALLEFVAPFLEAEEDRAYVQDNRSRLRVKFLFYDWSLNA